MRTRSRNRAPLGEPKFIVQVRGKTPFIAPYLSAVKQMREWEAEYGKEQVTFRAHKEQA
jgi:hypothetical protein